MGDTLYWIFILGGSLVGGLIAFNNDRQFMKIGFQHFVLYIVLMVTGAAIGAFYIAPALQGCRAYAMGIAASSAGMARSDLAAGTIRVVWNRYWRRAWLSSRAFAGRLVQPAVAIVSMRWEQNCCFLRCIRL